MEAIYDKDEFKKLNSNLYDKLISRYGDFLKFNSIKNIINEWEKFYTKELSKKNNLLFIKIKNILRFLKYLLIKPRKNEKFAVFEKDKIFNLFNELKKTDQILNKVHIEIIGPKLLKFRVNK